MLKDDKPKNDIPRPAMIKSRINELEHEIEDRKAVMRNMTSQIGARELEILNLEKALE